MPQQVPGIREQLERTIRPRSDIAQPPDIGQQALLRQHLAAIDEQAPQAAADERSDGLLRLQ